MKFPCMRDWVFALTWSFVTLLLGLGSAALASQQCPRPECLRSGGHDALLHLVAACMAQPRDSLSCPCAGRENGKGAGQGYVVLKDCKGRFQYLLLPSATVTGIEDPAITRADATNYMAKAWAERHFVADALGITARDDQLSLAINPQRLRSQNQFHIHIDCLSESVRAQLHDHAGGITSAWAPLEIDGVAFRARTLDPAFEENPFALLREDVAAPAMGEHSLLVTAVGNTLVLLDTTATAAERLQNHDCAGVKPAP